MIFTPRIMRKHIIASLTASFLLVRADIGENPDYDPFLLASGGELPDNSAANNDFLLASGGEISDDSANSLTGVAWDSTNLFTDPLDDSLQSSTDGLIAGAQPGCTSDADNDNVFFSRIRPRGEACLPPLNPPPNIYDLNTIFNQVAPPPPTLPKIPDRTTPDTDRSDLEKMWSLPLVDPDTKNGDEEEICPRELMGDSQIPVCSSPQRGRNELRLPQEDHWTLYNVRYWFPSIPCVKPEYLWCCYRVAMTHHPLDPPGAPDVLTGFICKQFELAEFDRTHRVIDLWTKYPWLDQGSPLYEPPAEDQ